MRRRPSSLGDGTEAHVDRFYRAFSALQDLGTSQRERSSCRTKYAALLQAVSVLGVLRSEYRAFERDVTSEDTPREAHLLRQAEDWVYVMRVDFDRRCAKRFR